MRRAPPAELLSPIACARAAAVGDTVTFGSLDARKLVAREIQVKEAFTFVDADGAFFRASLRALAPDRAEALVYERMTGSTESPARITLVCAVLSRQRMIPVVQKATELGCVRIVPALSDCSVDRGDLDREKPWAWPGQALRAARQCRRASLPEVLGPTPLADALAAPYFARARARFFLDDRAFGGGDPLRDAPASADYVLAAGPEGGWSDAERERLAHAGARSLALGARVLRAETAVYAGLAILQHRLGDLRSSTG